MKAKALAVLIPALFLATAAVAQPGDKSTTGKSAADTIHAPTAQERETNREAVTDTTITGKVKTALATDVGLKTVTGINVDTNNDGIVTLHGKVESADIKKRAGEVAKKVSGVKSVKNEITVASKK
jgi:hyperosmotically inducible protein